MSKQFTKALYVGRPNIGNEARFLDRVQKMLQNRWLSNHGPMVQEFETALQNYTGVRNCVAICNATIAMEIAAKALGIKDQVIVPAYTFVATAHAFKWQEIEPVFADMNPNTHNISTESIEDLITPRTTAIAATHVWGRPCEIERIDSIAKKHNLKVIYDAAHAFGCSHNGKMIGNFGNCEIFSFHATKFINSFEGGAIATNDDELAEKVRLMRNFGFQGFDNVVSIGTNGKMSEIHAAMGLTSLEAIEEIVAINLRNYRSYRENLTGISGLNVINYNEAEKNNYQYLVVELQHKNFPIPRDSLVSYLIEHNVIARKYFWPGVHNMAPYNSRSTASSETVQKTNLVAPQILVLPTGQTVDEYSIRAICDLIKEAIAKRTPA